MPRKSREPRGPRTRGNGRRSFGDRGVRGSLMAQMGQVAFVQGQVARYNTEEDQVSHCKTDFGKSDYFSSDDYESLDENELTEDVHRGLGYHVHVHNEVQNEFHDDNGNRDKSQSPFSPTAAVKDVDETTGEWFVDTRGHHGLEKQEEAVEMNEREDDEDSEIVRYYMENMRIQGYTESDLIQSMGFTDVNANVDPFVTEVLVETSGDDDDENEEDESSGELEDEVDEEFEDDNDEFYEEFDGSTENDEEIEELLKDMEENHQFHDITTKMSKKKIRSAVQSNFGGVQSGFTRAQGKKDQKLVTLTSRQRKKLEKAKKLEAKKKKKGDFRQVDIFQINKDIAFFVKQRLDSDHMALPPMTKANRRTVHLLANCYNLKSVSTGSGKSRYTTLIRTRNTSNPINDRRIQGILADARAGRMDSDDDDFKPRGSQRKSLKNAAQAGASTKPAVGTVVGAGLQPIDEQNVGNRLLRLMGWQPGEALGREKQQGIVNPVEAVVLAHRRGLGH